MRKNKNIGQDISLSQQMKAMRRGMRCRKIFRYFSRNHVRHTNYYYNKFIEILGLETWERLDPHYKSEWNSARNSFDRMNGLLSSWCDRDAFPEKKEETNFKDDVQKILPELSRKIDGITEQFTDKTTLELKKAVQAISDSAEQLKQQIGETPAGEYAKTALEKEVQALEKKLSGILSQIQKQNASAEKTSEKSCS